MGDVINPKKVVLYNMLVLYDEIDHGKMNSGVLILDNAVSLPHEG